MVNSTGTKNILKKILLPQKIFLVLFGLFLTIVILEIGLRIGGFALLSIQEYKNQQSIKQKGAFRIMCLGESTTQNQYPPYLEEILNQRNIGIRFSVIDKGLISTTTSAILLNLEANLDKYQPDMVVTMMGINDGGSHMPYEAVSTSKIALTLRSFKVYKLARLIWLHMEIKFKKLPKEYIEFYKVQEKFAEAEESLKKAIELNPNNASAYMELARFYTAQAKFAEAEKPLKKAIELNPNNAPAYMELGRLYRVQGKSAEAEKPLKKAIELNPKNDSAYKELGWFYRFQGKFAEAEESLKKAIELKPDNAYTYIELGRLYKVQEKFTESEESFKKAIELNPKNNFVYRELGELYRIQGKFTESEQIFKKAIELKPDNERPYRGLAMIYRDMGNNELFEVYAKKADSVRNEYYYPKIINNYRALKQILDKRRIKLVCVQYPMRTIMPLKKIFMGQTKDDIIFVDNEKIFKDATMKEGYKEYFKDMFGGDFGHCTEKGNRLLAENIANSILKEYFNK